MPATVLGFDTSGSWCSVALVRGAECWARRARVGNAHSTHLLPMIESVLAEAGVALDRCDAIAFGAGPGSFTGLRIACAAAQGLAFGAGLPVVLIGTLDAIARSALPSAAPGTLLVAQDARIGEVYWALFEYDGVALRIVDGPSLGSPSALRSALESRPSSGRPLGVGNAWAAYGEAMEGLAVDIAARDAADAVDIAMLGVEAFDAGRTLAAEFAAPLYVRDEVARTTAQREADAHGRAASMRTVSTTDVATPPTTVSPAVAEAPR